MDSCEKEAIKRKTEEDRDCKEEERVEEEGKIGGEESSLLETKQQVGVTLTMAPKDRSKVNFPPAKRIVFSSANNAGKGPLTSHFSRLPPIPKEHEAEEEKEEHSLTNDESQVNFFPPFRKKHHPKEKKPLDDYALEFSKLQSNMLDLDENLQKMKNWFHPHRNNIYHRSPRCMNFDEFKFNMSQLKMVVKRLRENIECLEPHFRYPSKYVHGNRCPCCGGGCTVPLIEMCPYECQYCGTYYHYINSDVHTNVL